MSTYHETDPTTELMREKDKDKDRVDLSTYFFRSFVSVVLYPVEYAKTLMQLGYEPLDPIPSVTFFGRPCLLLPNTFKYIAYIKRVDGLTGCYRGLLSFLIHKSVFIFTCDSLATFWDKRPNEEEERRIMFQKLLDKSSGGDATSQLVDSAEEEEPEKYTFKMFLKDLIRDFVCRLGGVTASHPFLVVSVQTMASFVGRERMIPMNHIWQEQGFRGYFNGLAPRLVGETISICILGFISYLVKSRIKSEEARACVKISLNVLTGALTYPFTVVSNTMMVNGSGLMLGSPPFMPPYASWVDCWSHLREVNVLRRGSSLVFRYYTGPTVVKNGVLAPARVHFGPDLTRVLKGTQ